MLIIGITGPSGSGKGTASTYLATKGAKTIDADAVYHELIAFPSPCVDEMVTNFGKDILADNGAVDRKKLAPLVFGEENKEKLLLLNEITHKYVVERIRSLLKEFALAGEKACVIDAPLLIEAGLTSDCNLTIAVLADKQIRAERIAKRDRIDINSAMARINSQKPDEYYVQGSDKVLYNNGALDELYEQLEKALTDGGAKL